MNFVLERVTQRVVEALTLAEMKLHLRTYSSNTDEDALISALIKAAREWVEDYTGRVLVDSTWRLTIGNVVWPVQPTDTNTVTGIVATADWKGIPLYKSPVIALVSVASVDSLGVETALDVADYTLMDAASKWPKLAGSLGADTLRIVYSAGFAPGVGSPDPTPDPALVPERFKLAMKLYAEAIYDRDEKLMPLLLEAAANIIKPERADLQIA